MFKSVQNSVNEKTGISFVYDKEMPFFSCVLKELDDRGISYSICGGRYGAKCGKCKVKIDGDAPGVTAVEKKLLTEKEIGEGVRLACQSKPNIGTKVQILFGEETGNANDISGKMESLLPDFDCFGVDLGTSTIAINFWNSKKRTFMDSLSFPNPQIRFGADIISRIEAQKTEGAKALSEELKGAVLDACHKMNPSNCPIYVAGNTVMLHIFAGEDAAGLGSAPFKTVFLDERVDGRFVLLPGISAFVGADITAGLVTNEILPIRNESKELLIDLGTNAEIVLKAGTKMFATSTAAGSAFSSSEGVGSRGIELLADGLRAGRIDSTGLIVGDSELSQQSIRSLQLAKAAVRCGVDFLVKKAGIDINDIDKVFIAGNFGFFLNAKDAVDIGMLPKELLNKIEVCGNASLSGSFMYDKIKGEVNSLLKNVKCIDPAMEQDFNDSFMKQVDFDGFV